MFFTLVLLFAKTMPVVAMSEIKAVTEGAQPTHLKKHEEEIDYRTQY